MKIGEFARLCEVSPRMIRFYEACDLLKPKCHANGYRAYQQIDVGFIKKVVLLNKAGVPLKDLGLMRECLYDRPQDFCDSLKNRLREQIDSIDEQISDLQSSQSLLKQLLQENQVS